MEKVQIFDTTMRDGRQCPGAWVSNEVYFKYIEMAGATWFDQIEAWFPSSSQSEWNQVHEVAKMAWSGELWSVVVWLCQLKQDQVEKTITALKPAKEKGLLHLYFPVDPELLAASVGQVDQKEIVRYVYNYVKMSTESGLAVQFSPEGYSRVASNFDFCTDLIRAAVSAGAKFINCPDTIGWASHYEWTWYYVENMRKHKQIIDNEFPGNHVVWSVHNHNDLWNAVENSLWGVVNGVARKIEGTVWWVGERAWNADLLQIIMNFRKYHSEAFDTSHIDISRFCELGRFVGNNMLQTQDHYPIIWANAFRHTSWGHVNALLKDPLVYHPFHPASVGWEISLLFGPQSWGNHAAEIVKKLGYLCPKEDASKFGQFVKDYYPDRYKWVSDQEVLDAYFSYRFPVRIDAYGKQWNIFTITGDIFWKTVEEFSWKTVLSWFKAFLDSKIKLPNIATRGFENREQWEGIDAIAVAKITVHDTMCAVEWHGESQDIEMASIYALLDGYKRYFSTKKYKNMKSI
jgi:2-isopropylmalate synthase